MSQDEELDAIANIIRDQLAPLPYKDMFPEKQEQVREIQQLIATLILEALIIENKSWIEVSKAFQRSILSLDFKDRITEITELTNQQKGEQ